MITSIPNWQDKTVQECLDYLLETTQVPSNRGRLTHTWVAENIALAVADGVYTAINAVSVPTALRYVTGNGIDTTATLWKQQAEAVAVAVPDLAPFLSTLKDFEFNSVPMWQRLGYEEEPDLALVSKQYIVAETREAMAEQLRPLQIKSTTLNAWLDIYNVNEHTVQEVQDHCDALLASDDGQPE